MRIRVGCEMTYELGQVTPMIAILNVHSSRVSDLERPDYLLTTPSVPVEGYRDSFGNWCNRLVAPAGTITLKTETVVRDTGWWDSADPGAEQVQIQNLPAETLLYLLGSPTARRFVSPTPPGASLDQLRWAGPACRRSAITCTIISPSATSTRARHVRHSRRLRRSKACAVIMLIWRSRSAEPQHPSALLYWLHQRHRPAAAACAAGLCRLDRGLSRWALAHIRPPQQ